MDFKQIIEQRYHLSDASISKLYEYVSEVTLPKGFHIFEQGKVEKNIFFIRQGIVRAYTNLDGKEVTFWIGREGDTLVSMNGYVNGEIGYETMELAEESKLYVLECQQLRQLFLKDLDLANWGRRYTEMELIATERRLISMLVTTSSERYHLLLEREPELLQRLPLGDIASYLGMSQVNLSRIRSKVK